MAERITVVPGVMYSARGRYRNCLRLSCCYPWNEAYERALVRVGELASGMGDSALAGLGD
ncbi:hypothetical protein [Aquitalea magnusonii]|uniref:hypothetical protein n=1 Tax=Aquitalea magnusonii TaxID=332411 RepID=UPI001EFB270E|nr:hypothetical protein [Aquitalea magnusonii]